MELDAQNVILILVGLLQAYFWFDKQRDANERKEMRETIKSMEFVLRKIEQDVAIARYVLFNKSNGESNDQS